MDVSRPENASGLAGGAGRANRRGQSMVEMVLCLPLLVLFLCGIIEFGFVIYQTGRVYEAARQCGRYAAMGAQTDQCERYIQNILPDFSVPTSAVSIEGYLANGTEDNASGENASGAEDNQRFTSGSRVVVTVDFAIKTLTPLPVYLIQGASGDTRRVRGQACFRREQGTVPGI